MRATRSFLLLLRRRRPLSFVLPCLLSATTRTSSALSDTALTRGVRSPDSRHRRTSLRMSSNEAVRVLGVCGGIGSGKSSASRMLVSELNCLEHIDADSVGHSIYAPGSETARLISEAFGEQVLNGDEIDRKKLGEIVFSDTSQMKKLERLVWPQIKSKIQGAIQEIRDRNDGSGDKLPIVVLEAAIMLDADWDDLLDGLWIVRVSQETALRRLMETRGLSEEESLKRISAQQTRRGIGNTQVEVNNGVISAVIDNNGSIQELKASLSKALHDPASWYPRS